MRAVEHYREAEKLLDAANEELVDAAANDRSEHDEAAAIIAQAQVHATLALAGATAMASYVTPDADELAEWELTAGVRGVSDDVKPIVWAFCTGTFGYGDDQAWIAMSDDGHTITQHVSSNRDWGIHDVGPNWAAKRGRYLDVLGTTDVDFRVLDHGDLPPQHVLDAAAARKSARCES